MFLTQSMALSTLVLPTAATATVYAYRRQQRGTLVAMAVLVAVGRLGRWVRSLGPDDSPTVLSGLCWPISN